MVRQMSTETIEIWKKWGRLQIITVISAGGAADAVVVVLRDIIDTVPEL